MDYSSCVIDSIPLEDDLDELPDSENKSEIGSDAVWSVSSAKPGFGVENLRDNNLETFWQSDGAQPHIVNIHFRRKIEVQEIAFHCNFKQDESYTPQKILIRAGTTLHDLVEIVQQDLVEPSGWTKFSLLQAHGMAVRTNLIQIAILSNHQGGRDSHLRQIKVFGPRKSLSATLKLPEFSSRDFTTFSQLK